LTADNNEIDTMFIDRRNDPESCDGNMLVRVTFTYMHSALTDSHTQEERVCIRAWVCT